MTDINIQSLNFAKNDKYHVCHAGEWVLSIAPSNAIKIIIIKGSNHGDRIAIHGKFN